MFQISDVLKDDAFAYIMGLSSADGIAVGIAAHAYSRLFYTYAIKRQFFAAADGTVADTVHITGVCAVESTTEQILNALLW